MAQVTIPVCAILAFTLSAVVDDATGDLVSVVWTADPVVTIRVTVTQGARTFTHDVLPGQSGSANPPKGRFTNTFVNGELVAAYTVSCMGV